MTAIAIQLAGSLVAILLLAYLAHWLGLGGDRRIRGEDEARQLAADAIHGFKPTDIALDRAGIGALLRDADGRVLLLRRHGCHFAARLIGRDSTIRLDRNFLTIAPADRRFGAITLDLGPRAQVWAASFRRLEG